MGPRGLCELVGLRWEDGRPTEQHGISPRRECAVPAAIHALDVYIREAGCRLTIPFCFAAGDAPMLLGVTASSTCFGAHSTNSGCLRNLSCFPVLRTGDRAACASLLYTLNQEIPMILPFASRVFFSVLVLVGSIARGADNPDQLNVRDLRQGDGKTDDTAAFQRHGRRRQGGRRQGCRSPRSLFLRRTFKRA